MTIEIRSREYKVESHVAKLLAKTHRAAIKLADDHLVAPINNLMRNRISNPQVLAFALIDLAYFILRKKMPQDKAGATFDVFAHFAKQRTENKLAVEERKKKLH